MQLIWRSYLTKKNKHLEERHSQLEASMTEIFVALLTGAIVGIVFSVLKLPLPAPPVFAGIAGIIGIYLGGVGYAWIIEKFFN